MEKLENYSVIMSVYQKVDPKYLKESIDSILNQTYKTNEFIIVKDGPLLDAQNDLLAEYLKKYSNTIKVLELEKNSGAGVAYNLGISNCTNKWAAIMDSDDIALPTKFEKQMNYLKKHHDIDAIGSNAVEFLNDTSNIVSTRIMPETNDEILKFAHKRCPMIQPTVIFRVSSVLSAGSYQESKLTEDYDLYIRMIMSNCKFYTYQEVLYFIRTSEDFFRRRGGIKYLKPILGFKYKYYKKGFYSFKEFIITAGSSLVVSIIPNSLRTLLYKKFLRS